MDARTNKQNNDLKEFIGVGGMDAANVLSLKVRWQVPTCRECNIMGSSWVPVAYTNIYPYMAISANYIL